MKRAAIFGSRGQLGVELATVLSARSYEVASYDRESIDITDSAAVEKVVAGFRPTVILNPAAYNQVDLAESTADIAFQINALAVRNLALAARGVGAQLVHYSTDYVFDGMAGRAYREEDPTRPLGAYAVSKLAGELYAQAYLEAPLVIRTSGVFGPEGIRTARGNFPELMLKLAKGRQPIRVVEDFVASPTYAPALAERTADLLERGFTGLLHIGGGTPISWYDWAVKIFAAAKLSPPLQATNHREFPTAARRPPFSALSNEKMESLGIAPMPTLDAALADYFRGANPSKCGKLERMVICIKNCRVSGILGVYEEERHTERDIIVNARVTYDASKAIHSDALEDALDYKHIRNAIMRVVAETKSQLLETLADRLVHELAKDTRITAMQLEIDKPKALRLTDSVSAIIEWQRP